MFLFFLSSLRGRRTCLPVPLWHLPSQASTVKTFMPCCTCCFFACGKAKICMIEGHPGFAVTATGPFANQILGMGSPEHPADQSADKSVRRPAAASESGVAARNPWEGLPLLRTGREKVVGFLADLFSFPTDREPEAKITGLNLYESMSRRYGNQTCLPSRDSAANYETCLKCRAERCCPPPRVTPAHVYGSVFARLSREHEAVANQETHCQTTGEESQSEASPRGGGKRPLQSFCASFGVFFSPSSWFEFCLCSSCFHQ